MGFEIRRQRRSYLAELAESVAEEYSPGAGRVNLMRIALQHNLTWSYNKYGESFDGLLECRNRKFHIFCNLRGGQSPDSGRARFTFAHELGHFFIPEHRAALLRGHAPSHPSFCAAPNPDHYVELEADFFAARMLIPEGRLTQALPWRERDLNAIRSVANVFGASLEATVRRVVGMPDTFAAMVSFRSSGTTWHRVSPQFQQRGLRRIRVKRPDSHLGSATATVNASGSTEVQIQESATSASHWFSNVHPGSERDIILREQALKTQFYTLTLITVPPTELRERLCVEAADW